MVYALAGEPPVPMGTLERFPISCASARAGPLIGLRLTLAREYLGIREAHCQLYLCGMRAVGVRLITRAARPNLVINWCN